jgi:hypothetical protein
LYDGCWSFRSTNASTNVRFASVSGPRPEPVRDVAAERPKRVGRGAERQHDVVDFVEEGGVLGLVDERDEVAAPEAHDNTIGLAVEHLVNLWGVVAGAKFGERGSVVEVVVAESEALRERLEVVPRLGPERVVRAERRPRLPVEPLGDLRGAVDVL